MCRDQDLISETYGRTDVRTDGRTDVRMKIEKPVLGRPPLGPANNRLNESRVKNHLYFFFGFGPAVRAFNIVL